MNPISLIHHRKQRALQLRSLRLSAKFTKSAFSRKSGLSRPCIDRIESGKNSWDVDSEIIYIESLKP